MFIKLSKKGLALITNRNIQNFSSFVVSVICYSWIIWGSSDHILGSWTFVCCNLLCCSVADTTKTK